MGLFSRIGKALGGAKPNGAKAGDGSLDHQLQSLNQDGRLHSRYVIQSAPTTGEGGVGGDSVARIELETGLVGDIKDISYGGIAVRFEARGRELPSKLPPFMKARLHLIDQSIECKLRLVRSVSQGPEALLAGFTIAHEGTETLVFLRDLIEPLRYGMSLMELSTEVRHERFAGSEWTCLRGDGPTDLIVKAGPGGVASEALLTFRMGEAYCEMSYQNGAITLSKTVNGARDPMSNPTGARMASSVELERHILRHGIYVFMCVQPALKKLLHPVTQAALKELGINGKPSSRRSA